MKVVKLVLTRVSVGRRGAGHAPQASMQAAGVPRCALLAQQAHTQMLTVAPDARSALKGRSAMLTRMACSAILPMRSVTSYGYLRAKIIAKDRSTPAYMVEMVGHVSLVGVRKMRREG